MGVPGFSAWFRCGRHRFHHTTNTWHRQRYPHAFQPAEPQPYDHVYIDMPSFLHDVMRTGEHRIPHTASSHRLTASNYKHFHALLHKRLDELFALTNPRKTVVLALDGPAPLAKLVTQRYA